MAPTAHDHDAALTGAEGVSEIALQGRSVAMASLRRLLVEAAHHDVPVLLVGETGTGKTTMAEVLHALSPRATRPFVRVDCPAATTDLVEQARAARAGTLFLDEVAELSHDAQAAALALVRDAYRAPERPELRVVASAHPDLEARVAAGRFRPELFYRLSVFEVRIPPLRERGEDILPLARRFVELTARRERRGPPELSPELERALLSYRWPGNVAELWSVVERMLILEPDGSLQVAALPERMRS